MRENLGNKIIKLCSISSSTNEHDRFISVKAQSLGVQCIMNYCNANPTIKKHFSIVANYYENSAPTQKIVDELELNAPSIIGFSINSVNFEKSMIVAKEIRRRLPGIYIVIGGPNVVLATKLLEQYPFVDIAIKGEGELIFEEYLLSVIKNKNLTDVVGLAFRKNGQIVFTGDRKEFVNPSDIPPLFMNHDINDISGMLVYETSRGCHRRCAYCDTVGKDYREFPIERVKEELSLILSNPNITGILFSDPNLAHNNKRFADILEFLLAHNVRKLSLDGFFSSIPKLSMHLENMRKAGFIRNIRICMQSASPQVLKLSRRPWMLIHHLAEIAPELIKNFPDARVELILGLPGETPASFRQGIVTFFKLGFRIFTFNTLRLYPETEFFNRRKELGLETSDDETHIILSTPNFTATELDLARKFGMKFQYLALLLRPEDIPFFESKGIDIIDMAENFDFPESVCAKYNVVDSGDDNFDYLNISMAILDSLSSFFENNYHIEPDEAKLICEYIRVKYQLYTFERHACESFFSRTPKTVYPIVHAYTELETDARVLPLLGLQNHSGLKNSNESATVFAIFKMDKSCAVPITVKDITLFRRLLLSLASAKSAMDIFNGFSHEQKPTVVKAIMTLQNIGLIPTVI